MNANVLRGSCCSVVIATLVVAASVVSGLQFTAAVAEGGNGGKQRPPSSTTTTTSTAPAGRPTQLSTYATLDPIVMGICGGAIVAPCWRDSGTTYHATLSSTDGPVGGAVLVFRRPSGSFVCQGWTRVDDGSASCKQSGSRLDPTRDDSYQVVFEGDDIYAPSSTDGSGRPSGVG